MTMELGSWVFGRMIIQTSVHEHGLTQGLLLTVYLIYSLEVAISTLQPLKTASGQLKVQFNEENSGKFISPLPKFLL